MGDNKQDIIWYLLCSEVVFWNWPVPVSSLSSLTKVIEKENSSNEVMTAILKLISSINCITWSSYKQNVTNVKFNSLHSDTLLCILQEHISTCPAAQAAQAAGESNKRRPSQLLFIFDRLFTSVEQLLENEQGIYYILMNRARDGVKLGQRTSAVSACKQWSVIRCQYTWPQLYSFPASFLNRSAAFSWRQERKTLSEACEGTP